MIMHDLIKKTATIFIAKLRFNTPPLAAVPCFAFNTPLLAAGIFIFFMALSMGSVAYAAHDNIINPFSDGKEYPQNPTEDFFAESGGLIFNFSNFSYLEEESYFLKIVVTVKRKEGKLFSDPLIMKIYRDPFWGDEELLFTRNFDRPYENRYTLYTEMKHSGRYKVTISLPGKNETFVEFPMTVGDAGKAPIYIAAAAAFLLIVLIAFVFVAKRKGADMPAKHKRLKKEIVSIFVFVAFFSSNFFGLYSSTAAAYSHHESLIQWKDYSAEVFAKAKKENKPIFMLVTAIWCHWCHVYEEKTLETEEVAEYINNNYIPVFVDYDKRKDIAGRYQASGLPITVIMAPNGEELISIPGYIPKEQLVANLTKTAAYIKDHLIPVDHKPKERELVAAPVTKEGLRRLMDSFNNITEVTRDANYGGFGTAAKKPFPAIWDYVLTYYEATKEQKWLDMANLTLDWMAGMQQNKYEHNRPDFKTLKALYKQSGQEDWIDKIHDLQVNDPMYSLYDPVEGGFFRYATRRDWTIPHYEKLLEDNADLIKLYLHAYGIKGNEKYKKAAEGAIQYVLNNLYDSMEHRFYGSQDADEIYYHFTAEERKKVKKPRVDKTSYSRTNARMDIALLYAAKVLKEGTYREIAENNLKFIKANLISTHGALSYYDPKQKKGVLNGILEENAWVALAFLEAYGHTQNKEYLETAESLIKFIFEKLHDKVDGGFYERNSTSKGFYKEDEMFLKEKPYVFNGITAYMLTRYDSIVGKKVHSGEAKKSLGLFIHDDAYTSSPYFQRVALYLLNH